jgi:hypothetical protein
MDPALRFAMLFLWTIYSVAMWWIINMACWAIVLLQRRTYTADTFALGWGPDVLLASILCGGLFLFAQVQRWTAFLEPRYARVQTKKEQ